MELPHIGRYTANAVLCFGFGIDAPLLDTDVIRVIERVFSVKTSRKRAQEDSKMWRVVSSLIPEKARDLNLAVLELLQYMFQKPKMSHLPDVRHLQLL